MHYVEVGALALLFKKSVTEFKTKPKLPRCQNIANIATFNVRTLNRVNQLSELTASAAKHRHYHSQQKIKYHDTGKRWIFVSASAWKNSVNFTVGGAGMFLSP